MPADSSVLDNALIAKLGADAQLLAQCPNGVYWDEAPPGAKRFVVVSLITADDVSSFDQREGEDVRYLVKAVLLKGAGGDVALAAKRIDALLEGGTLTAAGYGGISITRESRIRMTEVDEDNPDLRWFHRGGQYRVFAGVA